MKTPKRAYKQDVCPECRSVVHWYSEEVDNGTGYETIDAYGECCNEDCDFSVKGLRDHGGWEDHQQEARWIRKNREARLRHRLEKEIWKHERDEAKHKEFIRFINDSARLLHDLVPMSGAYGQDVEGS